MPPPAPIFEKWVYENQSKLFYMALSTPQRKNYYQDLT